MKEKKHIVGWTGSLGFIMASAGAAIGLGNLWRFPTMVGENGGGAFVFIYLICVCIIGIPMLIAEIAIGRHSGKNAFFSYSKVNKKWGAVGILAIIISLIGLSYYTVLGGWILRYIGVSIQGIHLGTESFFQDFTASAPEQLIFYLIYMALTAFIVMRGISQGIEKSCKILMPILFLFLLVLAARSCTLPNAQQGIEFFLKPDFSKITPSVWLMALGQVFFSLSICLCAIKK